MLINVESNFIFNISSGAAATGGSGRIPNTERQGGDERLEVATSQFLSAVNERKWLGAPLISCI